MPEPFRTALLLSMPQMQDPNFAKTVVLLCDYGPEGAFGLVLNRPTDMPASAMVRLEPPIVGGNELPLWIGGPVEPQRGAPLQRVEDLAQAPASRPHSLADCCGRNGRNDKECPPKSEGSSPEEPCKTGQSPSLETDSR